MSVLIKPEIQRMLVLVKPSRNGPDRVQDKRLVKRLLEEELACCDVVVIKKKVRLSRRVVEQHYAVHKGKEFYEKLVDQLADKDIIVAILEGPDVISSVRHKIGATDPSKAEWWTIRDAGIYTQDTMEKSRIGKYGTDNVLHASDSKESAEYEIRIWLNYLGMKPKPLGHYVEAEYIGQYY